MKKLRITVEGKSYDVTIEALDQPSSPNQVTSPLISSSTIDLPASAPLPVTAPAGPGVVVSPLGGMVVSLSVTVGQTVKAGDALLVIEAMKMNTQIFAPNDGTVAEILVNGGDAITEGQPLIRLS